MVSYSVSKRGNAFAQLGSVSLLPFGLLNPSNPPSPGAGAVAAGGGRFRVRRPRAPASLPPPDPPGICGLGRRGGRTLQPQQEAGERLRSVPHITGSSLGAAWRAGMAENSKLQSKAPSLSGSPQPAGFRRVRPTAASYLPRQGHLASASVLPGPPPGAAPAEGAGQEDRINDVAHCRGGAYGLDCWVDGPS